jgi:hypothetical protein
MFLMMITKTYFIVLQNLYGINIIIHPLFYLIYFFK